MNEIFQINSERLQRWIHDFAQIGRTNKGGVTRLALSDEDKEARDLFVQLAEAAGCSIKIDPMGNIFARRKGKNNNLDPVVIGSHIDSQPLGGRFDGIYGVLAALEVIYSLNDHQVETDRPVDLVNWTNEEGARFAPAMIGSAVFSGLTPLKERQSCKDAEGKTIGEELERIGYAGTDDFSNYKIHSSLEIHIEQGPVLENNKELIGVVTGALGQKWYNIEFQGMASHAGTTPMEIRQDALLGLSESVIRINEIGREETPDGRATVGMVEISPNSRNVIPDKAWFSVEFRHPSEKGLERMDKKLHSEIYKIADNMKLKVEIQPVLSFTPLLFSEKCIQAVRTAVKKLNYPHRDMVSGAGHDSCNISKIAPASMIFIPCVKGISHNELEDATAEWTNSGANVLFQSVLELSKE